MSGRAMVDAHSPTTSITSERKIEATCVRRTAYCDLIARYVTMHPAREVVLDQ
jgi:hypothetical protein